MSIKRKARTVVAALLVGGASALSVQAASAATPECTATGATCLSVFSSELGTYASPNFVEQVFGGVARIGAQTGLGTASSSDPTEDFINPHPGTVADYYAMGLVSAAVNRQYGPRTASQLEYAPDGIPSGLCEGIVTSEPFQGEPLTLMSCTIPRRTVFIIDTQDSPTTAPAGLFPIVSGATEDFAHPFAMSYPRNVNTAAMLPPIRLRRLRFLGPDRTLPADQIWGVARGIL